MICQHGDRYFIWVLAIGVVVFYLPFLSRQFIGDDWLCLAYTKQALNNPEIFFQRRLIYGYFRPLSLIMTFIWQEIFGRNAYAFSFINILLHAVNIVLLREVLKKFDLPKIVCFMSIMIFGFYYLNASVLLWISGAGDLWVTALSLLFILKTLALIDKPRFLNFIQVVLPGIAATLFKESGFITIGLFFLLMILNRRNPFSKEMKYYSISIILIYFFYLLIYFKTRTLIDKEIELGFDTIINLWYLTGYTIAPFSKRIISFIPSRMIFLVVILKITVAIMLPLTAVYALKKSSKAAIFFLIWSLMFLAPIAVFKLNLGLFDICPEKTVSRFMYAAVPGMAVVFSWLLHDILFRRFRLLKIKIVSIALIAIFIAGNYMIVKKVSGIFITGQRLTNEIILGFNENPNILNDCDTLLVTTDKIDYTHQVIKSEIHLQAIIFCEFDKRIVVLVKEDSLSTFTNNMSTPRTHVIKWDSGTNRLIR